MRTLFPEIEAPNKEKEMNCPACGRSAYFEIGRGKMNLNNRTMWYSFVQCERDSCNYQYTIFDCVRAVREFSHAS